jgi:signal transduction histidine kinase
MRQVLDNLLELSRVTTRQQRNVTLPHAATEAARQLRDTAASRGVTIRLADDLPSVEVNAAAVELCLTNLLSNGIKYADPNRTERWVEVRGRVLHDDDGAPAELAIEVADNGLGVPEPEREHLFERFFRAHETIAPDVEGTGLGLNIVRDVVEGIGGRVWAEFPGDGSVFAFTVPCRRDSDATEVADLPTDTQEAGAPAR